MDKSLSEQQEMLLFKAVKDRGGTLPVKLAENMYSSKSSARSAVDKLRLFGYVELKTPGYFRVVKLPTHLKQELKSLQNQEQGREEKGGSVSESSGEERSYSKQPV